MIEQRLAYRANVSGLDQAIRAVTTPGALLGVNAGPDWTVVYLDDTASAADQAAATGVAVNHDPVSLSVDKTQLIANGTDAATLTVVAPKPGAAPVTVTIAFNGISTDLPMPLVKGVATDTIKAADPCIVTVTLKDPANRSTDTLVLTFL